MLRRFFLACTLVFLTFAVLFAVASLFPAAMFLNGIPVSGGRFQFSSRLFAFPLLAALAALPVTLGFFFFAAASKRFPSLTGSWAAGAASAVVLCASASALQFFDIHSVTAFFVLPLLSGMIGGMIFGRKAANAT